jgi:hypothetical protein
MSYGQAMCMHSFTQNCVSRAANPRFSRPLPHPQGYQVFTQACGMLEMLEPRDAFLGTLCEFALANAAATEADGSQPPGKALVAQHCHARWLGDGDLWASRACWPNAFSFLFHYAHH